MASGNASDTSFARAPQRQRGRDRVASLTAAAAALFAEKGPDATTMTEIAARAGASIGSLYLFFPTKQALMQAMVTELADALSARLDALAEQTKGWKAAAIADALFAALADFLAAHPEYGVLIDQPGDEAWKAAIRARRREQIAALFENATPPLPEDQSRRLALIVPQLMRFGIVLRDEADSSRAEVLEELRAMLSHHLDR